MLEQNYRYDLLSPQKLLEKYVGKKIEGLPLQQQAGADERVDAELRVGGPGQHRPQDQRRDHLQLPRVGWRSRRCPRT
ncbi:MAG: hypothetical protein IPJ34_08855 [Myxococcales bacterium]|nr:hypothetical protein [Myxococcales bacterium]